VSTQDAATLQAGHAGDPAPVGEAAANELPIIWSERVDLNLSRPRGWAMACFAPCTRTIAPDDRRRQPTMPRFRYGVLLSIWP
jgi:hypothetical protein